MISMERMSENRPFVFRNGRMAAKQMEIVEIKCIGPDNDQVPKSNTVKIVYHPKNQLDYDASCDHSAYQDGHSC
jgi:hypothetical protein